MKSFVVFAVTLAVIVGFTSTGFAQPASTPSSGATKNASDAHFVQLLDQLANNRLERVRQINAKVPGSIPPDDVALLELEAKSVDRLVQSTKSAGQLSGYAMLLSLAETSQAAAAQEWKRVAAIQELRPESISKQDAEMVRLRAELADAILARGKAVANKPAQEQQNWALQLLFVELQSLHDDVQNLEERQ